MEEEDYLSYENTDYTDTEMERYWAENQLQPQPQPSFITYENSPLTYENSLSSYDNSPPPYQHSTQLAYENSSPTYQNSTRLAYENSSQQQREFQAQSDGGIPNLAAFSPNHLQSSPSYMSQQTPSRLTDFVPHSGSGDYAYVSYDEQMDVESLHRHNALQVYASIRPRFQTDDNILSFIRQGGSKHFHGSIRTPAAEKILKSERAKHSPINDYQTIQKEKDKLPVVFYLSRLSTKYPKNFVISHEKPDQSGLFTHFLVPTSFPDRVLTFEHNVSDGTYHYTDFDLLLTKYFEIAKADGKPVRSEYYGKVQLTDEDLEQKNENNKEYVTVQNKSRESVPVNKMEMMADDFSQLTVQELHLLDPITQEKAMISPESNVTIDQLKVLIQDAFEKKTTPIAALHVRNGNNNKMRVSTIPALKKVLHQGLTIEVTWNN
eukprot:CAMPEP_0174257272 /NCGR_PEP_ID=MMETSP0439-20130205/6437_1 /TAXON_ID=0 /ORGANISM="Stereomyxa ramosa, Strain Chinc5" /LENGTH=433 /DNA_ID=CAMNT_0015340289 /DNA_START=14 /DNA_END=1315 /DNA_ORIENTATION=-